MSGLFSPEFVLAVSGIIASVLIALVPAFDAVKVPLIAVITVLLTAVIAGLGLEKTAAARSTGQTQSERQSVKSQGASLPVKYPPPQ